MLVNLQAILLVTGFIGALGQIIQIPDTPTETIGGFSMSYMIAIDEEDQRVYVSDGNRPDVRVFNETGGLILRITAGLRSPTGMAIGTDGNLYIADKGNHRIVVTTKDGDLVSTVGTAGGGEGRFYYPFDVAIGPDGLLYVADTYMSRVQVLTLDGQFVKKMDLPGFPYSLAFGTDGRLHVTVPFYTSKILVFDIDGAQDQSVDIGHLPLSIYIDSCGYIYVTGDEDRIHIYDEYYQLVRTISFPENRFNDVARWEGKNEIWTTDYENNVYVFSGP